MGLAEGCTAMMWETGSHRHDVGKRLVHRGSGLRLLGAFSAVHWTAASLGSQGAELGMDNSLTHLVVLWRYWRVT